MRDGSGIRRIFTNLFPTFWGRTGRGDEEIFLELWRLEISISFALVHVVVIDGSRICSEDPDDGLWPRKEKQAMRDQWAVWERKKRVETEMKSECLQSG